jgi:esterase/lipase superfamily enzyme
MGARCIDYIADIARRVNNNNILVLLHGFNNTFPGTLSRAGSFVQDIGYDGLVIVWSWPSYGWRTAYRFDEQSVAWTMPHFIQFFQDIKAKERKLKLEFLAHSLGSRILMRLLFETHTEIADSATFAAPDADIDEFKTQLSAHMSGSSVASAPNVFETLYASAYDGALWLSKTYHRRDKIRAGWGGPDILVMPGVDSVDVNISGHSYLFEHPYPLHDFETLIKQQLHASGRGLAQVRRGADIYYVINP